MLLVSVSQNIELIKEQRTVFRNAVHAAKPPYLFSIWPLLGRNLLGGRYLTTLWRVRSTTEVMDQKTKLWLVLGNDVVVICLE